MASRESLYRKYRPQTFGDVVGQDHITRTLRNAITADTVAHAYLFAGPRGTGKTTVARILAKALDCEKGPTAEPDDTCESCLEITQGRHPDVHELDAASRTGVDAIRDEVINKVNYAATRGAYKIYIIDEVHMLSTSAFNALLKTLEEPPARTVFVLCTTHAHKVPETIRSRCQRFDFRRIGIDDIVGRLEHIAREEGISVEPGALALIARHSAGGMRDAIGTLDQLASFTDGRIALTEVEGLLGQVDTARLAEAVSLIGSRDIAGLFGLTARLAESGADVAEFCRGMTSYVRDLYVTAASGTTEPAAAGEADSERLRQQAAELGTDRLGRMLDGLGRLQSELRWAPDARLALEVALLRIARPEAELTLEALAERVSELERGAPVIPRTSKRPAPAVAEPAPGQAAHVVAPVSLPMARPASAEQAPENTAGGSVPVEPAPAPVPAPDLAAAAERTFSSPGDVAELRRRWPDVIRLVKEKRPAASKLFLDTEADLDGDTVVVEFDPSRKVLVKRAEEQDVVALLRESIGHALGWKVGIRYQLGRGSVHHDDPVADSPLPGPGHVQTSAIPEPASSPGDVDRALIEGLGAEVVAEKPRDRR